MKILDLNGVWSVKSKSGKKVDIMASIPGTIHTALEENGLLKDFYFRDNAEKYLWIEETNWIFERDFEIDEIPEEPYIIFEGLDTYATVLLNDKIVLNADDMFISHKVDVSGVLKRGKNFISVEFTPPDKKTACFEERGASFSWPRLYSRRVQCTYGWDWVPRIVTMGIIKPVYIASFDETEIDNFHIYTSCIDNNYAQLKLSVGFSKLSKDDTFLNVKIISPNNEIVYTEKRLVVEDNIYSTIDVPNAQLWYPNGYGEQRLYRLELEITRKSELISLKTFEFGIRTIRVECRRDKQGSEYYNKCMEFLEENKEFPDTMFFEKNEEYFGFVVYVNNVPIMCKGANWIPCEAYKFHQNSEKIDKLLSLAKDAHFNFIRVWGGGVFEEESFYSACDRYGLLVAQDFLMACGNYPDDDDMLKKFREEAEFAVKRIRNHASLCWWSGDNENAVAGYDNLRNYTGRRIVREVIEPVVRKIDPVTMFIPSSPFGGELYGSFTAGTSHNTGRIIEKSVLTRTANMDEFEDLYDKYLSRFNCEEPIFGAPSKRTLDKCMSEDDILGDDKSMWKYHTRNNPCGDFLNYDLFDYHEIFAEKILGEFKNPKDRLMKLQYIEYETVRKSMSLYRRNKWFSSGILYWMFNDIWPGNSWSMVDYYCIPKAGYYSFKKHAQGVIVAIEHRFGKYNFYVCNDLIEQKSGTIKIIVDNFKGKTEKWELNFEVEQNTSKCVFSIDESEMGKVSDDSSVIFAQIDVDGESETFIRYLTRPANVDFPKANIRVTERTNDYIIIEADNFVPALRLEGECEFSDNYFMLLPGQKKKVYIKGDACIEIYSLSE